MGEGIYVCVTSHVWGTEKSVMKGEGVKNWPTLARNLYTATKLIDYG